MSVEDRLRTATREWTERVRDIRPLELPVDQSRRLAPAPRARRLATWAGPVVAAAVVVMLAIALVTVRQVHNESSVPPSAPTISGAGQTVPECYAALPASRCRPTAASSPSCSSQTRTAALPPTRSRCGSTRCSRERRSAAGLDPPTRPRGLAGTRGGTPMARSPGWLTGTRWRSVTTARACCTCSCREAAIGHLGRAADLPVNPSLTEVRITALRRLGRAYVRRAGGIRTAESRADSSRGAWCWGEAHRLEEQVAARQVTDDVRIGMLVAAPDEHDERIRAANEAEAAYGANATAGIVVAMEAARGATILSAILPDGTDVLRDLPELGNREGAWRWLRGIARSLPRAQVAWLPHSTPDHVHHAIVGRGLLHHLCVPLNRARLEAAVGDLANCEDPAFLEASVASGEFDQALAVIARLIAVRDVVPLIPP